MIEVIKTELNIHEDKIIDFDKVIELVVLKL
jgi:hypothetical protein